MSKIFQDCRWGRKAGDAIFAVWPRCTATVAVLLVHFILRVEKYGIIKWVFLLGFFSI